jgi:hypothetical protein
MLMKEDLGWLRPPLFILFALCLGLYLDVWGRLSQFSIVDHAYALRPGRVLIAAFILFPLFVGLWGLSTGLLVVLFKEKFARVMDRDIWTYLPVLSFGLTPLALVHYLDRGDLALRLTLMAVVVIGAVLYLKIVLGFRLSREKAHPHRSFIARFSERPRRRRLVSLFVVSLLVSSGGILALRAKGVFFSGDEPHYLLIDRSLVHDHDFDLKDNYDRKDYAAYMLEGVTISPHVIKRTEAGPWYSFHSPGVAFVLLPFYVLGGWLGKSALIFLVRFGMAVFGALFGLEIYLFARREWGREGLALGLWSLVSFTAPVLFYGIHVYPEIIVALLGLTLFRLARHTETWTPRKLLAAGLLFSFIIWFHALKYLFLLAPLFLYVLVRVWKRLESRVKVLYLFAGPVVVGGLYLVFQRALYGSLSPSSISWQGPMSGRESVSFLKFLISGIPFHFRWETLAGYFLDQRDGLLFYAPIYVFAFLGAVLLLKRKRSGFWTLAFVSGPYVLVSAFLTQRTGYAPQARPLVAVIWALAILLGAFLAENRKKLFGMLASAAAFLGFGVAVLLFMNPAALYQETTEGTVERGGALFNQLSNLHYHLRDILPSFLKVEGRWWPNYVWLVILALFIAVYAVWRKEDFRLSSVAHIGLILVCAFLLSFWFAGYPRDMLLDPVQVDLAGGRLDFYSLSRAARMVQPARFNLVQDDRIYHFSFVSRQPLESLDVTFGSNRGSYAAALTLFDQEVFRGRTRREIRTVSLPAPPAYRLGRSYLYRLDINLRSKSNLSTAENPYLFALKPAW